MLLTLFEYLDILELLQATCYSSQMGSHDNLSAFRDISCDLWSCCFCF